MGKSLNGTPPASYLTCVACGTRNRLTWEFCVRCGEDMDPRKDRDVAVGEGEAEPVLAARRSPWRSILTLAGAAALVAAAFAVELPPKTVDLIKPPVAAAEKVPIPPPKPVPNGGAKLREGQAWLARGQPQAALGPLSEAAAAEPENPEAQLAYARALWGAGSREEAISRFESADMLGARGFSTEYANALIQTGRTDAGRKVLEESLADSPNDVSALEILGQLHNREGRPADGVAILTRAAALEPDDVQILVQLGSALERSGNPAKAAEVLSGVVARVPGSTVAREILAEAEFKQGRREEAVALLREGIEQKPDSPALRRRLGLLLERAGNAAEAVATYREYLRLAPDAADARAVAARVARLERGVTPTCGISS